MPKIITSPVARYSGTVTLRDPLPLDACVQWEEAQAAISARSCPEGIKLVQSAFSLKEEDKKGREKALAEYSAHFIDCCGSDRRPRCREAKAGAPRHAALLPAIRACVEDWRLDNFDPANPPGSPWKARTELIEWLVKEIEIVYNDNGLAEVDPNA
jgi:hypothetical protein